MNCLIIMFNEVKCDFLFVLWFTPMNWKSWSAAAKCRKTHPCDYRISKYSGGACPRTPLGGKAQRALPTFCPGVKLSCLPVQNLNEPPVQARKKGLMTKNDQGKCRIFAKQVQDNYSADVWISKVACYLDGVSLFDKHNPADQVRAPKGRIWWKKCDGLSLGCVGERYWS